MSNDLPEGYQVVCIKEASSKKNRQSKDPLLPKKCEEHEQFIIGEMHNAQFPLNLFAKISLQTYALYYAGLATLIAKMHKQNANNFKP